MKKLNKEIEDKIIDLYINKKMSTTKVAKEVGISSTGVSKIIKRNGYSTRSISKAKKGVKRGSKLPVDKVVYLYVNEEKTSIEIAKIIGCSKPSVLKILRDNEVDLRKPGYRENYKNPKTEEIKILYLSGIPIPEVANIIGMSYSGVNKILKKLNIIRVEDKHKGMLDKVISEEHKNKVRKTRKLKKESGAYDHIYLQRTGYTYKKYQEILPEFKKYYQKVRTITNQQPLDTLENYNKRGQAGVDGNYHLDHRFSIAKGFRNNIDPEIIGNIINLEMIPWEDNLMKNHNCSITKKELLTIYNHE
jgi:predicted transcriptional regulator